MVTLGAVLLVSVLVTRIRDQGKTAGEDAAGNLRKGKEHVYENCSPYTLVSCIRSMIVVMSTHEFRSCLRGQDPALLASISAFTSVKRPCGLNSVRGFSLTKNVGVCFTLLA